MSNPSREPSEALTPHCPICGVDSEFFDRGMVLGHVEASYFRCPACWAVFAHEPSWLDLAYSSAIAAQDIGLIARNLDLAEVTDHIITGCLSESASFIDFGAGNGMFVRLMRDRGHEFRYFDPHGPNLFAQGFELIAPPAPGADVVTALEVVEHLRDPIGELRPFVQDAAALLISTTLVDKNAPRLEDWWYYSLDSGQHITILSSRSLEILAQELGFYVQSFGTLHVLSRARIPRIRLALCLRFPRVVRRRSQGRRSLLESDYEQLFGRSLR